jgi:hypothetical protein|tara:strand:+ start:179 stop:298 length:120 start_codon:yes stop_codon:yes gene_type:complete
MKKIIKKILLIVLIIIGLIALGILDIVGVLQKGMDFFFC